MKKPKPPNSFEEVEAYVREKEFCVDPWWFWNSFSAADWYDTNGKPILSWKQKLWNLDKLQRSWGKVPRCSFGSCKKPGVYNQGRDNAGFPYYYCVDHKPNFKPELPKEMTNKVLKIVDKEDSISNKVNANLNKLKVTK